MMHVRVRRAALALLLAAGGVGHGCKTQDSPAYSATAERFQLPLAEALELNVRMVRDSLPVSDPVRLTYTVTNEGPLGRFRNDPGWLFFEVVDANGEPISSARPGEIPHYGSRPDIALPTGAFFGATVDLHCGTWQYGTRPDTSCAFAFDLSTPGRYKVVARYMPSAMKTDSAGVSASDAFDLADSVEFTVFQP